MAAQQLRAKKVIMGVGGYGPGQRALDVLIQFLDQRQFNAPSGPTAPDPTVSSTSLVADLMLDRRASALYQQAIDGWLAGGCESAFEAPLPLPPKQDADMRRRLAQLAAQNNPGWTVNDAPQMTAAAPKKLPMTSVLTGGPSATAMKKGNHRASSQAPGGKFLSASAYLDAHLAKAASGPGSRGGHVVGTTKTGKPIYGSSHESNHPVHAALAEAGHSGDEMSVGAHHAAAAHPSYSADDHLDAAEAHQSHAAKLSRGDPDRARSHAMSQAHSFASMSARGGRG